MLWLCWNILFFKEINGSRKIKSKIQKLVNHYDAGNYTYVIKEAGILIRKFLIIYF